MFTRWAHWLVLAGIFTVTSWSFFQPGFFHVHDFVHGVRIAEMSRSLQEGQFPVRWTENFGYGYGMPLFEFYAPLPFYLGALFYLLSGNLLLAVKLLFLLSTFGTVAGSYLVGRHFSGRVGGVVTATVLTLAPYRAVNLFVRGALSESWGMMALPWILWGVVTLINRLIETDRENSQQQKFSVPSWLVLVLSLSVLFLSHNLTSIIFLPFSVIFGAVYAGVKVRQNLDKKSKNTQRQFPTLLRIGAIVAGCYVLALGISAFYLLPSFFEKDFTQVEKIVTDYFAYTNHFLYVRQFVKPFWGYGGSGWGPNDDMSFFLGYGQLLSVLLAGGGVIWAVFHQLRSKERESKQFITYGLAVTALVLSGIGLFFTLGRSQFIWDALPLLKFVQFPWRFLSVAHTFLALSVGISIMLWPRFLQKFLAGGIIAVCLLNSSYFLPEKFLADYTLYYYDNPEKVRTSMSDTLNDYIPRQMQTAQLKAAFSQFELAGQNSGYIQAVDDRGHRKTYRISYPTPTSVALPIAYFPGWRAQLDRNYVPVSTTSLGNIVLDIPAGSHELTVFWGSTPIRKNSDLLSGLSIFITGSILVWQRTQAWNKKSKGV